MGRVFTIGVGSNFLQAVIDKLYALPSMSGAVVYVPTRRLGKALQTEILRHSTGTATLMPVIKTLGDGDDIAQLNSIVQQQHIPMAVSSLYRRFWLSDAIAKFYKAQGDTISLSMALASADDLGKLFDKVALFETDFSSFETLFEDGDYARHWGYSLAFLNAIYPAWDAHLQGLKLSDIGQYQLECLNALDTQLKSTDEHIFLVGATANYPVIKRMMKTVMGLKNGTVFIAGYDTSFTDRQQKNIVRDATHPFHTIQDFVSEIKEENIDTILNTNTARADVFKSVFLSAKDTANWRQTPPSKAGFENLYFSSADDINAEATSIALMMRRALETEGQTCALMTPDRGLSRMVISLLKRWNINVDDSSGQPLSSTTPALFMALVLQVVTENFSVKSIASLTKHPFCTMGMDRGEFNRMAQGLEMFGLRGYFGTGGIDDIVKHIYRMKDDKFQYHNPYKDKADSYIKLLYKIKQCFEPLLQKYLSFDNMVKAHIEVCENLSDIDVLWNKDDGNALASCMGELLENAEQLYSVSVSEYASAFHTLLGGKTVRKTIGLHPRLFIWGPLEARLQNVDIMIIGGMNEGVFPAKIKADSWLSRAMAGEVGLPISDFAIGVSANDFICACNGAKIIFSRSVKEDGKPSIASRWWQRFDAVAKATGLSNLPQLDFDYATLAKILDKPNNTDIDTVRISVPKPTPPVKARPKALSVTNIQTWIEDPYQIYAKYILELYDSGDLWGTPSPAIKGNILHATFEEFINNHPSQVTLENLPELIEIGKKHFGDYLDIPEVKGFWWTSFIHTAKEFVKRCEERNEDIDMVLTEKKAKFDHKTVGGNTFTISGTADRIEILKDGYSVIADYKTGVSIPKKNIVNGDAPQLGLEAYMLEKEAFLGVVSCGVKRVEIWKSKPKFEIDQWGKDTAPVSNIIENTVVKLDALVDKYANQNVPYYNEKITSKYNDYTHLMREKEWGLYDSGDGEDYDR